MSRCAVWIEIFGLHIICRRMTERLIVIQYNNFNVVFCHVLTESKCLNYATIQTLIFAGTFSIKKGIII